MLQLSIPMNNCSIIEVKYIPSISSLNTEFDLNSIKMIFAGFHSDYTSNDIMHIESNFQMNFLK